MGFRKGERMDEMIELLYILLYAIEKVIRDIFATGMFDESKKREMLDAIFETVKDEVLDEEEE